MKSFFRTVFLVFSAFFSATFFAADEAPGQDSRTGSGKDYKSANIALIREDAEKGVPEAQYALGLHCEKEKDMTEAVKWYRKAADQGDFESQYKLGVCYEKGEGVTQNFEAAFKWYKKAAEMEFADAQIPLGLCYENGRGVQKDIPEAIKWYRKRANHGDAGAQYRIGLCYESYAEVLSYDKAALWFRKSAERGYAEAQLKLGKCYEDGRGVEKSMIEAVNWYSKAAGQGVADAQLKLARIYENGAEGIPQTLSKAVEWYRTAVDQGCEDAQVLYKLGTLYEKWYSAKKDLRNLREAEKFYRLVAERDDASGIVKEAKQALVRLNSLKNGAVNPAANQGSRGAAGNAGKQAQKRDVEWFRQYQEAANKGDRVAQFNLGRCYAEGIGVQRDMAEALKWYERSADQSYPEAISALAYYYLDFQMSNPDERRIDRNEERRMMVEAFKWYIKAADWKLGNDSMYYALAQCYENGIAVDYDIAQKTPVSYTRYKGEAKRFYKMSAEQGNTDAMMALGRINRSGPEAVNWYRKAADRGRKDAMFNLAQMYEKGEGVEKDIAEAAKWYRKAGGQKK